MNSITNTFNEPHSIFIYLSTALPFSMYYEQHHSTHVSMCVSPKNLFLIGMDLYALTDGILTFYVGM